MKKKNIFTLFLIAVIFAAAGVVYSCRGACTAAGGDSAETTLVSADDVYTDVQEYSDTGQPFTGTAETHMKLCVYICGNVARPGVYYADDGSRIADVLDMAGGFCEDAAVQQVNLAAKVSDGQQIYVPSKDEAAGIPGGTGTFSGSAGIGNGLVDINTAGADELMTLPGIGEAKAAAIVSYRETNGGFRSIEEIQNVSGIKGGSFEKIKDRIKV